MRWDENNYLQDPQVVVEGLINLLMETNMTTLTVQDRTSGKAQSLTVQMTGARSNIIAYVNRVYPQFHIVSFND